jgi:hypothetical protein
MEVVAFLTQRHQLADKLGAALVVEPQFKFPIWRGVYCDPWSHVCRTSTLPLVMVIERVKLGCVDGIVKASILGIPAQRDA